MCAGNAPKDLANKKPIKPDCLAAFFRHRPTEIADALLEVDLNNDTVIRDLASVPVSGSDWFTVSLAVAERNPVTALKVLRFAERNPDDLDLLTSVALSRLSLAKKASSIAEAEHARRDMRSIAERDPKQRLRMVGAVSDLDERELVIGLCKSVEQDPGIVWPCVAANPDGLSTYLGAIAQLPSLTFNDVGRLAASRKSIALLPGLRCLDVSTPQNGMRLLERPKGPRRSPAEVVIYHRLHRGAPTPKAQCLLEEAAYSCLSTILTGSTCPVLSSIADFVQTLDDQARFQMITSLIVTKNEIYPALRSGSPNAKGILFHLHLVIGEILAARRSFPAKNKLWLPQYHVAQAREMFAADPNDTSKFADYLSGSLKVRLCTDQTCEYTCSGAGSWGGCAADCTSLKPAYFKEVCP